MFKGKFVFLSLILAAALSMQMMPAGVDTASSGIVNPCSSTASTGGGEIFSCPSALGNSPNGGGLIGILSDAGISIAVAVRDDNGIAVAGIPAADFWLIGCADSMDLCGGSGGVNADSASNADGLTTISGQLLAGGCVTQVQVVVQGVTIADPNNWANPLCLDISVVTPDSNNDLAVNLGDFGNFAIAYPSISKGYVGVGECFDYDFDSDVDLGDFNTYSQHHFHTCN
jgi:hypothetical protein